MPREAAGKWHAGARYDLVSIFKMPYWLRRRHGDNREYMGVRLGQQQGTKKEVDIFQTGSTSAAETAVSTHAGFLKHATNYW